MKRLTNVALIGLVAVGLSIPVVLEWRSRLLTRLQQCRREIPTSGRQYFASPCESMHLRMLVLAGIPRAQMETTLGASEDCFDRDPFTDRWRHGTCLVPAWTFYSLPTGSLGGGPNLTCWAGDGKRCWLLYWEWTA